MSSYKNYNVLPLLSDNLDNLSYEIIIEQAKVGGELFRKKDIKANQIRNFYGAVNKLKLDFNKIKSSEGNVDNIKNSLILLKPQLAYVKGRNPKTEAFTECMDVAINKTLQATNIRKAIENFFVYVESVVAYHKFYGDK